MAQCLSNIVECASKNSLFPFNQIIYVCFSFLLMLLHHKCASSILHCPFVHMSVCLSLARSIAISISLFQSPWLFVCGLANRFLLIDVNMNVCSFFSTFVSNRCFISKCLYVYIYLFICVFVLFQVH